MRSKQKSSHFVIQHQFPFVPQVIEVIVKLQIKEISDKMMHIWDFKMSTAETIKTFKVGREKKKSF